MGIMFYNNYVVCIGLGVLPGDKVASGRLEADGFPAIGTFLQEGDPLYRYYRIAFTLEIMITVEPPYKDTPEIQILPSIRTL